MQDVKYLEVAVGQWRGWRLMGLKTLRLVQPEGRQCVWSRGKWGSGLLPFLQLSVW